MEVYRSYAPRRCRRSIKIVSPILQLSPSKPSRFPPMKASRLAAVLVAGCLLSTPYVRSPIASAQTPGLPPGANTTNPNAPFYIDLRGLDFKTTPPTRNPANTNYPQATELPDGTLPAKGAQGNYIIGPTHKGSGANLIALKNPVGNAVSPRYDWALSSLSMSLPPFDRQGSSLEDVGSIVPALFDDQNKY